MENKTQSNQQGFTLIELLVVIAILAVLATLYVPRIIKSSNDAERTVAIVNARTLASEITMYNASHTTKILLPNGSDKISSDDAASTQLKAITAYTSYKLVHAGDAALANAHLLDGRDFPDSTYVVLIVDGDGNCFICQPDGTNIGSEPTPTPAS